MKKNLFCLFLFLLVFSLTGCVKFNANMDIRKDKSMNYSIIYAIDTSIFGDTSIIESDQRDDLINKGYSVSDYVDGNMKGVTLSREIKNIDYVSNTSSVSYDLSGIMEEESDYIFSYKKGFFKNTYSAKIDFDASKSSLNNNLDGLDQFDSYDSEEDVIDSDDSIVEFNDSIDTDVNVDEDFSFDMNTDDMPDFSSTLSSSMDLSFNVKLPYSAVSNNATSTSDNNKSLSWNLTSDSINSIEFEFELYNFTNILILAGGSLLFLILIVVIILSISRKKKNRNSNVTVDTFAEVPELNNSGSDVRNFSEQSFNQQFIAQSLQGNNQSLENTNVVPGVVPDNVQFQPNVINQVSMSNSTNPTSVIPDSVNSASVVSNGVNDLNSGIVNSIPSEQSTFSQEQNIFNSNFEIISDVPSVDEQVNISETYAFDQQTIVKNNLQQNTVNNNSQDLEDPFNGESI